VTSPLLCPFITHGFEVNGFYLSSDWWPAIVAIGASPIVWVIDRQLMRDAGSATTTTQ